MQNTETIRRAIGQLCAELGSQRAVAARLGVANSTVGDWVSGKSGTIRVAHWSRLQSLIGKHLNQAAVVAETGAPYDAADVDPLCQDVLDNWDNLAASAQNEILRIVAKYRK